MRDSQTEQERVQTQAMHERSVAVAAALREQKRAFMSKVEELENNLQAMRTTAVQHSDAVSSLEGRLHREEAKVLGAEANAIKMMQRIEKLTVNHAESLARESQKRTDEVDAVQERSELLENQWVTEREALEEKFSMALEKAAKKQRETRSELIDVLAAQKDLQSEWARKQSSFEYEVKSNAAQLAETQKMVERVREDARREMAQLRKLAHEEKERHAADIKRERARVEAGAGHEAAAQKAAEVAALDASEKVKRAREESATSIRALQSKLEGCLRARASRVEELEAERDALLLSNRRKEAEHSVAQAQLESQLGDLLREKERALQRENETSAIVDKLKREFSELESKKSAAAAAGAAPPPAVPAPPASKPVPKTMNAGRLKLLRQEMRARRRKQEEVEADEKVKTKGKEGGEEEEEDGKKKEESSDGSSDSSDDDQEEQDEEAEVEPSVAAVKEEKEEVVEPSVAAAMNQAVEYLPGSTAASSYWISKDPLMEGRLSQSRETHVTLRIESEQLELSLANAKKQLASRSASLRRAGRRIEAQRLRVMQLEAKLEKKTKAVRALTVELASMAEEKRRLSAAKTSLAARAKNEHSRATLLAAKLEQQKRTGRLLAEKLQASAEHLGRMLSENARLRDERVDADSLSAQLRGAEVCLAEARTDLSTLRRFQHLALGIAQNIGTKAATGEEQEKDQALAQHGVMDQSGGTFFGGACLSARATPVSRGTRNSGERGVPLTPNTAASVFAPVFEPSSSHRHADSGHE